MLANRHLSIDLGVGGNSLHRIHTTDIGHVHTEDQEA